MSQENQEFIAIVPVDVLARAYCYGMQVPAGMIAVCKESIVDPIQGKAALRYEVITVEELNARQQAATAQGEQK